MLMQDWMTTGNVIYFLREIQHKRDCSAGSVIARCLYLCYSCCIEIKINQSENTEMKQKLCLEGHALLALFPEVAEHKLSPRNSTTIHRRMFFEKVFF